MLAESLPGISRQTRHAQLLLARNCLATLSAVHGDNISTPHQLGTVPKAPEHLNEPNANTAGTAPITNSNDLLPSIRPRSTPAATPGRKKRRRIREPIEPDAVAASDHDGGSFLSPRPSTRLAHIGGIDGTLQTIRELTEWPLFHREIYSHLGVSPPRGILLHGPPGCGKTLLAHAIAGELGVSFLKVTGPEVVSSMSGESERKLRNLFAQARRLAPSIVFIDEIDAIASRKEGATKDMERRIVSQLISCIDETSFIDEDNAAKKLPDTDPFNAENSNSKADVHVDEETNIDEPKLDDTGKDNTEKSEAKEAEPEPHQENAPKDIFDRNNGEPVPDKDIASFIVIAATNRPESIEPALRRAGRFDREIEMGAPDEDARVAILKKLCRKLRPVDNVDFGLLAKRTAGYVGADLDLLVREAGMVAVRRFALSVKDKEEKKVDNTGMEVDTPIDESQGGLWSMQKEPFSVDELSGCSVSMDDIMKALGTIQPSALREGFATRPDVTWADVGALEDVREELMMAVVEPIRRHELFSALGLRAPAGVLLYGPPGCGKTLLARAVASESGANFISVKGPELLSKYLGDSELAVRKLFARARSSSPCVIFFDELDALAPRRGGEASSSSSGASERVVNMLLTEMDGFGERKQVFLVAATNRPDIIDPAMLRPGRLDKLLYVGLPTSNGRVSIISKLAAKMRVASDVNVTAIARDSRCAGFSGADLSALLRAAGEQALREQLRLPNVGDQVVDGIHMRHFEHALKSVLPSVSPRDAKLYSSMQAKLRKSRAHLAAKETDEKQS